MYYSNVFNHLFIEDLAACWATFPVPKAWFPNYWRMGCLCSGNQLMSPCLIFPTALCLVQVIKIPQDSRSQRAWCSCLYFGQVEMHWDHPYSPVSYSISLKTQEKKLPLNFSVILCSQCNYSCEMNKWVALSILIFKLNQVSWWLLRLLWTGVFHDFFPSVFVSVRKGY